MIRAWWKLARLAWKERPDALVSFSVGVNLLVFFTFYKCLILRMESNIFHYKTTRAFKRYFQKWIAQWPHIKRIVIPSTGLYERCEAYFKTPQKLVQVSNPLPIETVREMALAPIDDFPQLRDGRFIVSAGRLNVSKGFVQLISVFGRSRLRNEFKLVIVGDGPLWKTLEELILENELEDCVVLTGFQSNPYRFFARARFLVMNSGHESFGNVLIESMACGTPPVSNDCDFGPRHIIQHYQNGLLYRRVNEAEFIKAMERLAFDDALYERLKVQAQQDAEEYNVTKIADIWMERVLPR